MADAIDPIKAEQLAKQAVAAFERYQKHDAEFNSAVEQQAEWRDREVDARERRDAARREFGRLLVETKATFDREPHNTNWSEWAPAAFGWTLRTIQNRMKDYADPEAADRRRKATTAAVAKHRAKRITTRCNSPSTPISKDKPVPSPKLTSPEKPNAPRGLGNLLPEDAESIKNIVEWFAATNRQTQEAMMVAVLRKVKFYRNGPNGAPNKSDWLRSLYLQLQPAEQKRFRAWINSEDLEAEVIDFQTAKEGR